MKMVSRIESRQQALRMLRVTHRRVKVDNPIEMTRFPNPIIHRPPVGFGAGSRMVKLGSNERQNRSSDNLKVAAPRTCNHLFVGGDYLAHHLVVLPTRNLAAAPHHPEIVDSLENDQVPDSSLFENIMIETFQSIRSKPI